MRYNSKTSEDLSAGLDQKNSILGRTKYPGVDVFRLSNSFFAFGLVLSLLTCIFAFNWTTYDDVIYIPDDALEMEEEIEVEPPRTCLLYTSPSPRDSTRSRMPSSA